MTFVDDDATFPGVGRSTFPGVGRPTSPEEGTVVSSEAARAAHPGIGHRAWVVPGGHIPFPSRGREPEFTSFDQLCVLNSTDHAAELELTVYYDDQEPVGPYRLVVPARRIRHVRLNDLIDPEAIRLDRPFGCLLRSTVPVVVQFLRQDTRLPGGVALTSTMAFPVPDAHLA